MRSVLGLSLLALGLAGCTGPQMAVTPEGVETVEGTSATAVQYVDSNLPAKTRVPQERDQILRDMRRQQDGGRSAFCTPDAPVMYGGTLYCLKR